MHYNTSILVIDELFFQYSISHDVLETRLQQNLYLYESRAQNELQIMIKVLYLVNCLVVEVAIRFKHNKIGKTIAIYKLSL